jgi:hypothetical protein
VVRDRCLNFLRAPGRYHAIVLGVMSASGDPQWGGITFSDADNVTRIALPVGRVAWRRYYGPDKLGEVAEFEVPDGPGVHEVELRMP